MATPIEQQQQEEVAAAAAAAANAHVPKCRGCSQPFASSSSHVPISSFSCSDSLCRACVQWRLQQQQQQQQQEEGASASSSAWDWSFLSRDRSKTKQQQQEQEEIWIPCPLCHKANAFCQRSLEQLQLQATTSSNTAVNNNKGSNNNDNNDDAILTLADSSNLLDPAGLDDPGPPGDSGGGGGKPKAPTTKQQSTTSTTTPTTSSRSYAKPRFANMRGKFDDRLDELKEFKQQHGHCRVPHKYIPNLKLGYFCSNIRKFYRKKQAGEPTTLSDDQIEQLQRLGFEFNIHGPLTDFQQRIQDLRQYYQQHGHVRIPATRFLKPLTEKEENPHWQLGSFIGDMRKEYKLFQQNKPSRLTLERIKALEEVGMEWSVLATAGGSRQNDNNNNNSIIHGGHGTNASFEVHLQALKDFYAQHSHFRVSSVEPVDASLKAWVYRVRNTYLKLQEQGKASDSFLTPENIQALKDIQFDFTVDNEYLWNQRYQELKDYFDQHGHCRIPTPKQHKNNRGKKDPTVGLTSWMSKQREHYRILLAQHPEMVQRQDDGTTQIVWPKDKKNRYMSLTAERIRKLDEISFDWILRPSIQTFEERLEALKEHKKKLGHVHVQQDRSPNNPYKSLGRWLSSVRQEYNKKGGKSSRLTPERLKALEDLGVDMELNPGGALKKTYIITVDDDKSDEKDNLTNNNNNNNKKKSATGKTPRKAGSQKNAMKDEDGNRLDQLLMAANSNHGDSMASKGEEKSATKRRSSPRKATLALAATKRKKSGDGAAGGEGEEEKSFKRALKRVKKTEEELPSKPVSPTNRSPRDTAMTRRTRQSSARKK